MTHGVLDHGVYFVLDVAFCCRNCTHRIASQAHSARYGSVDGGDVDHELFSLVCAIDNVEPLMICICPELTPAFSAGLLYDRKVFC